MNKLIIINSLHLFTRNCRDIGCAGFWRNRYFFGLCTSTLRKHRRFPVIHAAQSARAANLLGLQADFSPLRRPDLQPATAMDGGSAENAGAAFPPTAMDGGSAENAGAAFPPTAMDGGSAGTAGAVFRPTAMDGGRFGLLQ
jgi:hypothetical protein